MIKANMEYSNNTLYIYLKGNIKSNDIKKIKRKLYYIICEYGINTIIIDVLNVDDIDKNSFYDFLDEYDIDYGGRLELVGSI